MNKIDIMRERAWILSCKLRAKNGFCFVKYTHIYHSELGWCVLKVNRIDHTSEYIEVK